MTEGLERFVDRVLREQPPRQAPPTLEARVLLKLQGELDARAGAVSSGITPLPWWRRGFAHWPVMARVAFLLASYGFVRLALAGVMSLATVLHSGEVAGALSPATTWLHVGATIVSALVTLFAFVARTLPAYWLYGAMVSGIALYVALFGLGTVAYRTLYVNK